MLPWIYEFRWEAGHIIFVGGFMIIAVVILTALTFAALRVYRNYKQRKVERVLWHAQFEDLPALARTCRHEIGGYVKNRTCNNYFDCNECVLHKNVDRLEISRRTAGWQDGQTEQELFGLTIPSDRLYHRGHTWVKEEADGTLTVGLDDFGSRLIGKPDEVKLPKPGDHIEANGTAWRVKKSAARRADVRVLAPVTGKVIETGGPDKGWYLKVKPDKMAGGIGHLLSGKEIMNWLMKEIERLQLSLSDEGVGASLADGGVLLEDLPKSHPDANWDGILGEMFLEE